MAGLQAADRGLRFGAEVAVDGEVQRVLQLRDRAHGRGGGGAAGRGRSAFVGDVGGLRLRGAGRLCAAGSCEASDPCVALESAADSVFCVVDAGCSGAEPVWVCAELARVSPGIVLCTSDASADPAPALRSAALVERADDAVDGEAVAGLEAADGRFGFRAEDAVDFDRAERLLEQLHLPCLRCRS